jgi:hypothetical protein
MSRIVYNTGITPLPASKEKIVTDTLDTIGIPSITVTSTFRTPAQQALAMYNNIMATGIVAQKKLYGPGGDKVIDEFNLKKNYGYGKGDILKAMERKIIEVGPSKVSAHCLPDPENHVTFDISPSSVPAAKKSLFEKAMKKITSNLLIPGVTTGEPVYHAEIKTLSARIAETGSIIAPLMLLVIGYFIAKKYHLL